MSELSLEKYVPIASGFKSAHGFSHNVQMICLRPILLTRVAFTEKQTGCQMAKCLLFAININSYDFVAGVADENSMMIFLAGEEISYLAGMGGNGNCLPMASGMRFLRKDGV